MDRRGYKNRSEAIRDLIRAALIEEGAGRGYRGIGVLSYVYDHHTPRLVKALTALQHDVEKLVISSMHVHLDHRHCLEVVVLKGGPREMKAFADRTLGTRGVKHGSFSAMPGVTRLP